MSDYAEFKIRFLLADSTRCAPARDLRTGGGRLYRRALGASAGKVESVPGCPSLTLDLDELWSELDALDQG